MENTCAAFRPSAYHVRQCGPCTLREAAPDLLAALQALLNHEGEREANGIGIEEDSEVLAIAKQLARSAINKAEGRSPEELETVEEMKIDPDFYKKLS